MLPTTVTRHTAARRAEWPSSDLQLMSRLRRRATNTTDAGLRKTVADLIKDASASVDFDQPYYSDGTFVEIQIGQQHPEDYEGEIVQAMYHRGRQQSAIWHLFTGLCDRGVLDPAICLREPINWASSMQPSRLVYRILRCFSTVYNDVETASAVPDGWANFEAPIEWLSVVIARGCADPDLLVTEIETAQILGYLQKDVFEKAKARREPLAWECDPMIDAGKSTGYFAFWLPHGLGDRVETYPEQAREGIRLFNRIEEVYKAYFQVPDDEI